MLRWYRILYCLLLPVSLISITSAWPMTAYAQMEEETPEDDFADFGGIDTNQWSFRSGALFLNSGRLSRELYLSRGNLIPVLFTDAINAGYSAGWEFEFERRLNENWCLSGRYFQADSFRDELNATGLVNGAGVRYLNTVSGVLGAVTGTYNLVYGADLSSVELLAKRQLSDSVKLSAGIRYFQFDDSIATVITGSIFTSRSNTTATNDLTGFQLGSEIYLFRTNRFELIAEGLAGVYQNQCSNQLRIQNVATRTSGFSAERTSFVGEVDCMGRYRLRDHISIEGGYRFLWLDGIAMANQQAIINPAPGTGAANRINNSSELFVHGATVRLIVDF